MIRRPYTFSHMRSPTPRWLRVTVAIIYAVILVLSIAIHLLATFKPEFLAWLLRVLNLRP